MQIDLEIDSTLITEKNHSTLMRTLFRETAERHRDVTLPRHFTTGAYGRYGFPKRSKKYQIRKARKYRHQLPNVWTGKTRELVSQSRVTATQDRSRLYIRGHFPMTKERRAELEIITEQEGREMGSRIGDQYVKRIPLYRRKRKPKRSA